MEKTKYFNDTKPSEIQLDNTEDSKIRQILHRDRSFSQFGVRTGFRVTVNNGDATKIDIGPGEGYTGGFFQSENLNGQPNSGERISTITDSVTGSYSYQTTAVAQALADYSSGIENYITLLYVETESHPLAERTYPFTHHNTILSSSYQVSVVTETQWNSLSSDEREHRILVAIVTARGAGVALSSADIDQVVQPKGHPISAANPVNITGVSINNVSDETLIGNGTLRFEVATNMLYWTAPGDAEGIGVGITSSGQYTLYSSTISYYIVVYVIFASLPVGDQTDTIGIISLYGREIPLASAIDQAHRDMLGTGVKSARNPHAVSLDDISGAGFEHADLFHINGISYDAEAGQLLAQINLANDTVEVANLGSNRNSFLVDGTVYTVITGFTIGNPGIINFDVLPAIDSGDYLIYIDSAGALQRVKIAEYAPGGAGDLVVLWDEHIQIYDMKNTTAGNGTITWNGITQTLKYEAPGDGAAGDEVHICEIWGVAVSPDGYYKLYSNNPDNWVIVRVTGALGASTSSTFNITKNEIDHSDESILKVAIVTWNAIGELLGNLRDIRTFRTADTKNEIYEEHATDGSHTKVLRNQLRVARDSNCIYAYAANGSAIRGYGGDGVSAIIGECSASYGVVGICSTKIGVYGSAPNTGGYFYADTNTGAYASAADSVGIYAYADSETAGYFVVGAGLDPGAVAIKAVAGASVISASAHEIGIAGGITAFYGMADKSLAYVGDAPNSVASFEADTASALIATAISTAGYFKANTYAVYGRAAVATAGYFSANNTGIYVEAAINTAIYGRADGDVAGHFYAVGDTGLKATADNYGIIGWAGFPAGGAGNTGVYGKAESNYGVYGTAVSSYGGYFKAGVIEGIYASAPNTGGHFVANVATAGYFEAPTGGVLVAVVNNDGVMAYAGGATACYGRASNIGVCASATGANCTALYAENLALLGVGIYATGNAVGIVGSGTCGVSGSGMCGVRGSAAAGAGAIGVHGTASAATATAVFAQASHATATALVAQNTIAQGMALYIHGPAATPTIEYDGVLVAAGGAMKSMIPILVSGTQYSIAIYT